MSLNASVGYQPKVGNKVRPGFRVNAENSLRTKLREAEMDQARKWLDKQHKRVDRSLNDTAAKGVLRSSNDISSSNRPFWGGWGGLEVVGESLGQVRNDASGRFALHTRSSVDHIKPSAQPTGSYKMDPNDEARVLHRLVESGETPSRAQHDVKKSLSPGDREEVERPGSPRPPLELRLLQAMLSLSMGRAEVQQLFNKACSTDTSRHVGESAHLADVREIAALLESFGTSPTDEELLELVEEFGVRDSSTPAPLVDTKALLSSWGLWVSPPPPPSSPLRTSPNAKRPAHPSHASNPSLEREIERERELEREIEREIEREELEQEKDRQRELGLEERERERERELELDRKLKSEEGGRLREEAQQQQQKQQLQLQLALEAAKERERRVAGELAAAREQLLARNQLRAQARAREEGGGEEEEGAANLGDERRVPGQEGQRDPEGGGGGGGGGEEQGQGGEGERGGERRGEGGEGEGGMSAASPSSASAPAPASGADMDPKEAGYEETKAHTEPAQEAGGAGEPGEIVESPSVLNQSEGGGGAKNGDSDAAGVQRQEGAEKQQQQQKQMQLEAENTRLKKELSAFDGRFFEQVEDLKFSHSQAVERVRELQRFSVQLCEQAGVEPAQVPILEGAASPSHTMRMELEAGMRGGTDGGDYGSDGGFGRSRSRSRGHGSGDLFPAAHGSPSSRSGGRAHGLGWQGAGKERKRRSRSRSRGWMDGGTSIAYEKSNGRSRSRGRHRGGGDTKTQSAVAAQERKLAWAVSHAGATAFQTFQDWIKRLDNDRNGYISVESLVVALQESGYDLSGHDVGQIALGLEADETGAISLQDMWKMMWPIVEDCVWFRQSRPEAAAGERGRGRGRLSEEEVEDRDAAELASLSASVAAAVDAPFAPTRRLHQPQPYEEDGRYGGGGRGGDYDGRSRHSRSRSRSRSRSPGRRHERGGGGDVDVRGAVRDLKQAGLHTTELDVEIYEQIPLLPVVASLVNEDGSMSPTGRTSGSSSASHFSRLSARLLLPFRRYDEFHTGYLELNPFLRALDELGLQLAPPQAASLIDRFAVDVPSSSTRPSSSSSSRSSPSKRYRSHGARGGGREAEEEEEEEGVCVAYSPLVRLMLQMVRVRAAADDARRQGGRGGGGKAWHEVEAGLADRLRSALRSRLLRDTEGGGGDWKRELRQKFRELDQDGNGVIDRREFSFLFRSLGVDISKRELERVLSLLDADDDGSIDYTDLLAFFTEDYGGAAEEEEDIPAGSLRLRPRVRARLLRLLVPQATLNSFTATSRSAQRLRRALAHHDVGGVGSVPRAVVLDVLLEQAAEALPRPLDDLDDRNAQSSAAAAQLKPDEWLHVFRQFQADDPAEVLYEELLAHLFSKEAQAEFTGKPNRFRSASSSSRTRVPRSPGARSAHRSPSRSPGKASHGGDLGSSRGFGYGNSYGGNGYGPMSEGGGGEEMEGGRVASAHPYGAGNRSGGGPQGGVALSRSALSRLGAMRRRVLEVLAAGPGLREGSLRLRRTLDALDPDGNGEMSVLKVARGFRSTARIQLSDEEQELIARLFPGFIEVSAVSYRQFLDALFDIDGLRRDEESRARARPGSVSREEFERNAFARTSSSSYLAARGGGRGVDPNATSSSTSSSRHAHSYSHSRTAPPTGLEFDQTNSSKSKRLMRGLQLKLQRNHATAVEKLPRQFARLHAVDPRPSSSHGRGRGRESSVSRARYRSRSPSATAGAGAGVGPLPATVSFTDLQTCFRRAGFLLSDGEFGFLASRFGAASGDGGVDVRAVLDFAGGGSGKRRQGEELVEAAGGVEAKAEAEAAAEAEVDVELAVWRIRRYCASRGVELADVFRSADKNRNGALGVGEVRDLLEGLGIGLHPRELLHVMRLLDVSGDGEVSFADFCHVFLDWERAKRSLRHGKLGSVAGQRALFARFDRSGDGYISLREFRSGLESLGVDLQDWEITALFRRFDVRRDGRLDLSEFASFLSSNSATRAGLESGVEEEAEREREEEEAQAQAQAAAERRWVSRLNALLTVMLRFMAAPARAGGGGGGGGETQHWSRFKLLDRHEKGYFDVEDVGRVLTGLGYEVEAEEAEGVQLALASLVGLGLQGGEGAVLRLKHFSYLVNLAKRHGVEDVVSSVEHTRPRHLQLQRGGGANGSVVRSSLRHSVSGSGSGSGLGSERRSPAHRGRDMGLGHEEREEVDLEREREREREREVGAVMETESQLRRLLDRVPAREGFDLIDRAGNGVITAPDLFSFLTSCGDYGEAGEVASLRQLNTLLRFMASFGTSQRDRAGQAPIGAHPEITFPQFRRWVLKAEMRG